MPWSSNDQTDIIGPHLCLGNRVRRLPGYDLLSVPTTTLCAATGKVSPCGIRCQGELDRTSGLSDDSR